MLTIYWCPWFTRMPSELYTHVPIRESKVCTQAVPCL